MDQDKSNAINAKDYIQQYKINVINTCKKLQCNQCIVLNVME